MRNLTVVGRLTRDAELKQTQGGPLLAFAVASNKKVKGEESVMFFDCSLFGKRGEALAQYLSKGSQVCVTGELEQREYQGKTYLQIRVNDLELIGGKPTAAAPAQQHTPSAEGAGMGDDGLGW